MLFKMLALALPSSPDQLVIQILSKPQLYLAAVTYAIAALLWILTLKQIQLSLAYPIMIGLSIVIVRLISLVLWAEQLSRIELIGTAMLIIGVMLISQASGTVSAKLN